MKQSNFAISVLFLLSLVVLFVGLVLGAFYFTLFFPKGLLIWLITLVAWALLYGLAEALTLLQGLKKELHESNVIFKKPEETNVDEANPDGEMGSTLILYGYTENYLDNPEVIVTMNGEFIGELKHKGILVIEIKKDCDLNFSVMMKNRDFHVLKGSTKALQVSMAYKTLSVKDISETI
jgi:energy-coupling factor transporter transmembrane protein EcfT